MSDKSEMSFKSKINPDERAYQLQTLRESKCPGCRNCAEMLVEHPDAIKLTCNLCGSAYEPARPWARGIYGI